MTDSKPQLNNPLRYSIEDRTIDLQPADGVRVTEIDVRPSEGNLYVHWEDEDE